MPKVTDTRCYLAQRFTAHRMALWVVKDAPIYCLDSQLLQQFQQTDIGDENLNIYGFNLSNSSSLNDAFTLK
ncbi:MAG: hypothetical protein V7L22_14455 [Nostoc sp.]|uniref:hypothetical protein n=1 Tax=Nostoc sp. TaxID=1180 RepID=UPI002FFB5C42